MHKNWKKAKEKEKKKEKRKEKGSDTKTWKYEIKDRQQI